MNSAQHPNMFEFGHRRAQIYAKLQENYATDVRHYSLWEIVLIGCAIGAGVISHHWDWLWLFGGLFALSMRLSRFIDNSNRNWMMHLIDWLEHPDPESEAEGATDLDHQLADPAEAVR